VVMNDVFYGRIRISVRKKWLQVALDVVCLAELLKKLGHLQRVFTPVFSLPMRD